MMNKRAKVTEELTKKGMKLGTDMQITAEEEKEADKILKEATELNNEYIELLKTTRCKLCTGWGHNLVECSVFKSMEDFASSTPALYQAWGRYKANQLKVEVEIASKHSLVGSKRSYEKMVLGVSIEDQETSLVLQK